MRKQILLTVFALLGCCTAAWADIRINEENFPDGYFRKWVLRQEYGKDGLLTDAEIAEVASIEVNDRRIQMLQGIEFFTALKYLNCSDNWLMELDVSQNTALRWLYCGKNQLTELDVSQNTALEYLNCGKNQLTELDVSQNTKLKYLGCEKNQLTELDVSKNTKVIMLDCYSNQIKGAAMDALVESLPTVRKGEMIVIYFENEQNVMTTVQVKAAKAKGWKLYTETNKTIKKYKGSSQ